MTEHYGKRETYRNLGEPNEAALERLGFRYYDRKMKVSMVYFLTKMMIPRTIVTDWGENLIATDSSYVVTISPLESDESRPIDELPAHPIQWDIFTKTYKPLSIDLNKLNKAERSLINQGCRPFYKFVGVWGKLVTGETWINGLEHGNEEVEVPVGHVLMIGVDGEPYHTSLRKFVGLYEANNLLDEAYEAGIEVS